jgi:hypothetical protein
MRKNTWWPWLICGVLTTACEPRTVEISGLDELTAEIRSQRLLNREQTREGVGSRSGTAVDRGAQIQSAMAPLRDVLTQLGSSQSELAERQTALTQELRRWTQLLVQSMQSERSDEAVKLSKRLAELEKTISEQDKRHRKVEELIGSALDRTADQLEQFLNQVGANTGAATSEPARRKGGGQETPKASQSGNGEAKSAAAPKAATNTGAPAAPKKAAGGQASGPTTLPPSEQPKATTGKMANQQGSLAWLWGLAAMSLLAGSALLFSKRRARPFTAIPKGPSSPMQGSAEHRLPTSKSRKKERSYAADQGINNQETSRLMSGASTIGALPNDSVPSQENADRAGEPAADKPEIEELWAAAALLGEAIGRLKNGNDAADPPTKTEPAALPTPESTEAMPLDFEAACDTDFDTVRVLPKRSPDHADTGANPPSDVKNNAGQGKQSDIFQPEDSQANDAESAARPLRTDEHREPSQGVQTPQTGMTITTTPSQNIAPSSSQTDAHIANSTPVTCRLHLQGDKQAESRVRSILGRDPRVLASPRPQVRCGVGGLEVSYWLVPGLTAGEHSLLDQQLRDTVS